MGYFIQILKMEKMFLQNKSCLRGKRGMLLEFLVWNLLCSGITIRDIDIVCETNVCVFL